MNTSPAIEIFVNGEARQIASSLTVSEFVTSLELNSQRVAVELNRDILPRAQWPATILQTGDKLEIVHFVGGG